jgi:hypothetical protein
MNKNSLGQNCCGKSPVGILIFENYFVLLADNTYASTETKYVLKRWKCEITESLNVALAKSPPPPPS